MRQRNDTHYTQTVMRWPTEEHPDWVPFEVLPGEVTDKHPEPLAGFTVLDDKKPPAARKTDTATPAQTEGAETL